MFNAPMICFKAHLLYNLGMCPLLTDSLTPSSKHSLTTGNKTLIIQSLKDKGDYDCAIVKKSLYKETK